MSNLKFVFTTDWHVTSNWPRSRRDNFLETILGKIEWVVDFANKQDAHLILGGDLIDKYNTNPKIINTIIRLLRKARNQVFGIIGNHDVYGHNYLMLENVIIGTLFTSGIVKLLTNNPVICSQNDVVVQLTGANYMPNMDAEKRIYSVRKEQGVDIAIHVVHGFLVTKHHSYLEKESYTLLSEITPEMTDADVILSGHEHQGFGILKQDGRLFSNPGSLGRISSNLKEIGRMPMVTLVEVFKDHAAAKLVLVPANKGSVVLSREHIEEEKHRKNMLTEFSASLTDEREVCDLDYLFKKEAKIQGIDEEVSKISWEAITSYEAKLVGKLSGGE